MNNNYYMGILANYLDTICKHDTYRMSFTIINEYETMRRHVHT